MQMENHVKFVKMKREGKKKGKKTKKNEEVDKWGAVGNSLGRGRWTQRRRGSVRETTGASGGVVGIAEVLRTSR